MRVTIPGAVGAEALFLRAEREKEPSLDGVLPKERGFSHLFNFQLTSFAAVVGKAQNDKVVFRTPVSSNTSAKPDNLLGVVNNYIVIYNY